MKLILTPSPIFMTKNTAIRRREALEKLAKLSVYTAPTVITLLSASSSMAAGSCTNMANLNKDKMGMNIPGDGNTGNKLNNDSRRNNGASGNTATDC